MVEAKTAYRSNFLFFRIFLVTSSTNFAFAFFSHSLIATITWFSTHMLML